MLGSPGQGDRVLPRSLNGVIEQMEKFSSSLDALSSRVEASHLTTAQERELGIRQQDRQLRGTARPASPLPAQGAGGRTLSVLWAAPALQERLGLQQRDMEEERSRLQEVIGKMEAHLSEQSRLLEQVSRPPPRGARLPEHQGAQWYPQLTSWASGLPSAMSPAPSCPGPPSPPPQVPSPTAASSLPSRCMSHFLSSHLNLSWLLVPVTLGKMLNSLHSLHIRGSCSL